jgi:thiol-disulfide isomerase/thioredoxin
LQKTCNKIQKIETVNYQFNVKEFDSYSGQLNWDNSYTALFDFNNSDTIIGAHYLITNKKGVEAYDGSTTFYTNNERHELIYSKVDSTDDLNGLGYFSIIELCNLIPEMINDTSIFINRLSDTIINKKSCYQYSIGMHKKSIGYKGKIVQDKNSLNTTDDNGDSHYQLIINKKDNLPEQFIVFSYHMTPFKIISYKDYNFSPKFDKKRLDYSVGYPNFELKSQVEIYKEQSINDPAINTKSKDWILPSINGDSIQLSQLKSNLTLLEFWFPGCSGCATAIPHLNEIHKKYKQKGLKVFGIEYTNRDSVDVAAYILKMKIKFPTLYSAKDMAKAYKVGAAPTYVLINDQGIIVSKSFGFNKEFIINEIEQNL